MTDTEEKRRFYQRHRDDEWFDRVEIVVVPRYKTSGLSGDEWRVSASLRFYRKGDLLGERAYGTIEQAAAHLPWLLKTLAEDSDTFPEDARKRAIDRTHRGKVCMQPSCAKDATVHYRLRAEFSREGYRSEPSEWSDNMRAFCDDHSTRGDCGLEDADANYERVSGPEPSPPPAEFVREALRAEPIDLTDVPEEKWGEAIEAGVDRIRQGKVT